MNRVLLTLVLVALVSSVGAGSLFWVQNSSRTTQLSLDLWLGAWQLQQPVQVPVLMAVCFATGFVVAAVLFGVRSMRASSRARRLEQELALSSTGSGSSDGWKS